MFMNKISKITTTKNNSILLSLILVLAFFFRIIGLNWDQGQHLHPDERFLTMVLADIKLPPSLKNYLDPNASSLNPYNNNYSFFVYGSFPINFIKIIGEMFKFNSYDQIYLVGRFVTVLLDTSIIFLIYLICTNIFSIKTGLIASFLYSIYVLPIQLAHFYTVDPFLNFFIILSFYVLVLLKYPSKTLLKISILSLVYGAALASKISAVYFLPVIFIFFIFYYFKKPPIFFLYGFIFSVLSLLFFRFNQPQAFSTGNFLNWIPNTQFINNLQELQSYNNNPNFPPSIQWLKSVPIIFPLKNIVFWGLGLPLGILFILSIIYCIYFLFNKSFKKQFYLFIVLFWIIFLFLIQGTQSVTTMRYFLPIYPFIAITSAIFIIYLQLKIRLLKNNKFLVFTIILLLIYPLSFISIYFKEHPRVTASNWIYQNISIGSTLASEYWDDSLPLSTNNKNYSLYQQEQIHVADKDSKDKMITIDNQLKNSNYLILSSNRFYIPIPKNDDYFPLTTKYYKSLFDGSLGFQQVAQFTSYPCFPPIGKPLFCLNDTNAEEAFTVYDHPKVIIFQKVARTD